MKLTKFRVAGRKFKVRHLSGDWELRFAHFWLCFQQALNRRDQAALRKLSAAIALDSEGDEFLPPCIGVICASQDPTCEFDPGPRIKFWADEASNELTRAQMLQILEAQAARQKSLKELEETANWALELAAKYRTDIRKDE